MKKTLPRHENRKIIISLALAIGLFSAFWFWNESQNQKEIPPQELIASNNTSILENETPETEKESLDVLSTETEANKDPDFIIPTNDKEKQEETDEQPEIEENPIDENFPEVEDTETFKEIQPIAEKPSRTTVDNDTQTSEYVLLTHNKVATYSKAQTDGFIRRFYGGYPYEPSNYSVEKWEITFTTRHEKNKEITGNAIVYLPVGEGPFPIMGSASGTTGIDDACAPSRENVNIANWGDYEGYHASFAGQGYAVVFPDYSGFNDTDGLHHYFIADLEAKVVLDSIKALRNLAEEQNYPLQEKI